MNDCPSMRAIVRSRLSTKETRSSKEETPTREVPVSAPSLCPRTIRQSNSAEIRLELLLAFTAPCSSSRPCATRTQEQIQQLPSLLPSVSTTQADSITDLSSKLDQALQAGAERHLAGIVRNKQDC
jgi:hypothetical protein